MLACFLACLLSLLLLLFWCLCVCGYGLCHATRCAVSKRSLSLSLPYLYPLVLLILCPVFLNRLPLPCQVNPPAPLSLSVDAVSIAKPWLPIVSISLPSNSSSKARLPGASGRVNSATAACIPTDLLAFSLPGFSHSFTTGLSMEYWIRGRTRHLARGKGCDLYILQLYENVYALEHHHRATSSVKRVYTYT